MKNIQSFLYPTEAIILPSTEEQVVLVDIPQMNILQTQKEIDEFKKEFNITDNSDYSIFLQEAAENVNYLRKRGTPNFKDGEINYGNPHYSSLRVYCLSVSQGLHDWITSKVGLFTKKAIPAIDQLTEETAKKLVDDILKKKFTEQKMNSLNWYMQKQLIITLGDQLAKLLAKSGLIYISLTEPLMKERKGSKNK